MNFQSSNTAIDQLLEEGLLDEYPQLKAFFDALNNLILKFDFEVESVSGLSEGKRIAHTFNSLVEMNREVMKAKENLGLEKFVEEDFERELVSKYGSQSARNISLGEMRAIRVAGAYKKGVRPSFVGAKDTPMEAALQVAAYLEGLSLETGPETIRKSIQRFRASIAGQELFRFDEEVMKWETFDSEAVLLDGLPNHSGRPRKARDET
jgi:hypothetical protein